MYGKFQKQLQDELQAIEEAGLYKRERIIVNPQGADIKVSSGSNVLNFCANNYLGLSSHPEIINAVRSIQFVDGFQFFSNGTWDDYQYWEEAGYTFFKDKTIVRKI